MSTTNPTKPALKYFVCDPSGTTVEAAAARAAILTYAGLIKATEPVTANLLIGWVAYLTPSATT
jgi:hypothetical protein